MNYKYLSLNIINTTEVRLNVIRPEQYVVPIAYDNRMNIVIKHHSKSTVKCLFKNLAKLT